MSRTRLATVAALSLAALALTAGCGAAAPPAVVDTAPSPLAATSSSCPLSADDVSAVVGRPVQQRAGCVFGSGAATVTITVVDLPSGAAAAFDAARGQAAGRFGGVLDVPRADRGFVAYRPGSGVVTGVAGTTLYTVTMAGLPYDRDGYQTVGVQLLEAMSG